MSKLGLLSAGFSAILGREVVLQEGGATYSIHDVFKQTYVMKPPGFRPSSQKPVAVQERFPIFVNGLFGFDDTLTLQVTEGHSVLQMKHQILEKVEIELGQFDVLFGIKRLDDDGTVKDYGLQPESTIYLALRLKGDAGPLTVSTDELAPEFDIDFTNETDDGKQYMRGGFEYKRPYGWQRFAVRAVGRYENDEWLGPDGIRTSQASGEWPVSYHGTDMGSAEKIVKEGYQPGPGAKCGRDIYTSPSLEVQAVSTDELAPEFDIDFTNETDDGKRYMRGAFEYKPPHGWQRLAVRAVGRYENDEWLGPDDIRTSQASGEWPVFYHGTDMSSADKIVKEGYQPGPGAKCGRDIYTSPSLEMVERFYAQEFSYTGKRYKIAFQNRVNPDLNGHLVIISASETGAGADYWLSPKDNDDVRPRGILIREVGLQSAP